MIRIQKYIVPLAIALSSFAFGQGLSSTSNYPQSYENQVASAKDIIAPEKLVLSPKEQIDININSLIGDHVLKNAKWGFVVYDPSTKKVINSYNETTPFVPASTTKLLTTQTAYQLLGEKFHWLTQLEYSGEIDVAGTLNGNLYIVGSGDYSLGTNKAGASSYRDIIANFMTALVDKGIKKVNGNIIIQTAVFKENKMERLPENIVWLENNNYYLPVGSTQNINPANEKIIAKQKTPFSTEKRYFYISPFVSNRMVYTDNYTEIPLTTKLPDAPAYLATNFRASLIKSGLPVSGKVVTKMTDIKPEQRAIVATYKSPSLEEIVFYTNQHSDNALAEATVRMVGFQKKGDQTLDSGRATVLENLKNRGFDTEGLNYMDGSGLSKSNTVTPIAQAKFLSSLMNEKYFKTFFDSLPIAGQSGTLKKMFLGQSNGQIFAKTGTLNKVKCLAGYIKTRTGKTLTFSLLVNNYSGSLDQVKKKMEQLLEPTLEL